MPAPDARESMFADYASLGYSLESHPLGMLRQRLRAQRYVSAAGLQQLAHDSPVRVAGLVLLRQRPATASGVTFVTLEDETGPMNLVIWRDLADRQRRIMLETRLLGVCGKVQRGEGVIHVIASRLLCLDAWLGELRTSSRDFH